MSVLLTVMFSSHLEIALKAARRCEHNAARSRICSTPPCPGPPHRPCRQHWDALPDAIPSSCSESCPCAELSRMSPGHLAPGPAAITSYLFNKIKTCLVGLMEGRDTNRILVLLMENSSLAPGWRPPALSQGDKDPPSGTGRLQWGLGGSTANTPHYTSFLLGFPIVSFPVLLVATQPFPGSGWVRTPRGKPQLAPQCCDGIPQGPQSVWSLCTQAGMAIPPGPPQSHGQRQGMMEADLSVYFG